KPYTLVNFLNYGLKCIFIVFLLFSIFNWNQIQHELNQKMANLSLWNKTKNIYSTKVTYNGENNRAVDYKTSQVLKEFYHNMEKEKLLVFIIMLIVANVVITYNAVSSYYQKNKLELYVKKIFGYSAIERNKLMICLLLSINVIPMIIMYFYFGNIMLLSGIGIIALELLASYVFDKRLSRKTFNSIIKGEH
ncbi:DUF1430 domain-containing protein, partial [Bacillus thuringiensis]